jgi:Zn-dependent protease
VDIQNIIQTIAVYALPVLFAITVHEAAHGYVARHFGDNTATLMGRVTLNPIKHIDLMGTIIVPLVLYVVTAGQFLFGYAKPVPINFSQLRNPERDSIWVALAGPVSNLLMGLAWGALFYILIATGVREPFFLKMCQGGVLFNALLFVFNLLPLPPLDGGRVLVGLLPYRQAVLVSRIEPYGLYILIALILAGVLTNYWIAPLTNLTINVMDLLLSPLKAL